MLLASVSTALHVTEFKLCECFLLRTDRKHSTSSDFTAPDFGSSDALSSCRPAQSSAHWRVRLYAHVAIDLQASRSHRVDGFFFAKGQLTRRSLYFYPCEKFFWDCSFSNPGGKILDPWMLIRDRSINLWKRKCSDSVGRWRWLVLLCQASRWLLDVLRCLLCLFLKSLTFSDHQEVFRLLEWNHFMSTASGLNAVIRLFITDAGRWTVTWIASYCAV